LLAEKYTRDVATFREAFFGKLTACCKMSDDLSWAIFNGEEQEGGTETLARRKVLLSCGIRYNLAQRTDDPVHLIRLITNEPVSSDNGVFSYLTKDVTILENGRSVYLLDAVQMEDRNEGVENNLGTALAKSSSVLFFADEHNELFIAGRMGQTTRHSMVRDTTRPYAYVYPYGHPIDSMEDIPPTHSMEDTIYALDSAWEILQSVMDVHPSHSS
jgi:hypothetical protein